MSAALKENSSPSRKTPVGKRTIDFAYKALAKLGPAENQIFWWEIRVKLVISCEFGTFGT